MKLPENIETNRNEGGSLTIAHLSDLHIFSDRDCRFTQLLNKRMYGYLSWRWRRGREHLPEILAAMLADLHSFKPGQIAVTGDLTHLGRPAEYRRAFSWIKKLGCPEQVILIPGNHDAYVAGAWEAGLQLGQTYFANKDKLVPYRLFSAQKNKKNYQQKMSCKSTYLRAVMPNWVAGKVPALEISAPNLTEYSSLFPIFRRCQGVVFCGLNTAGPRPWWLATGAIGKTQLEFLDHQLEMFGRQGLGRVILLHHPPVPGIMNWRKRLEDEKAFCEVVRHRGAELILHGHSHRATLTSLPAGKFRVPVFGVPAASASGRTPERRARYNLYRLERVNDHWQVSYQVRRYSFSGAGFINETGWQQIEL